MSYSRFSSNRRRRIILSRGFAADGSPIPQLTTVVSTGIAARFLTACGGESPLRVVIKNESGSHLITADKPYLLLGRSVRCDVRLAHRAVSDRHLYLQLIDGRLYCYCLAPRASHMGMHEDPRSGWLHPDDCLKIGPYSITLPPDCERFESSVPDDRDFESTKPRPHDPGILLEFPNAPSAPSYPLTRPITLIGQGPLCRIRIRQQSVSLSHSSLVQTPEGLWVVDLLGRGGTLLEGQPVRYSRVENGQELQVGKTLIKVRYVSQAEHARARHPFPDPPGDSSDCPRQQAQTMSTNQTDNSSNELIRTTAATLPAEMPSGLSEDFVLSLVDRLQSQHDESLRTVTAHTNRNQELMSSAFAALCDVQREQAELLRAVLQRMDTLTDECRLIRQRLADSDHELPSGSFGRVPHRLGTAEPRLGPREKSADAAFQATREETAPAAPQQPGTSSSWPASPEAGEPYRDPSSERDEEWLRERLSDVEEMLAKERKGLLRKLVRSITPG